MTTDITRAPVGLKPRNLALLIGATAVAVAGGLLILSAIIGHPKPVAPPVDPTTITTASADTLRTLDLTGASARATISASWGGQWSEGATGQDGSIVYKLPVAGGHFDLAVQPSGRVREIGFDADARASAPAAKVAASIITLVAPDVPADRRGQAAALAGTRATAPASVAGGDIIYAGPASIVVSDRDAGGWRIGAEPSLTSTTKDRVAVLN